MSTSVQGVLKYFSCSKLISKHLVHIRFVPLASFIISILYCFSIIRSNTSTIDLSLKQPVRPILTGLDKPTVHFIYFRTLTFEVVDIYTLWGLFPPLGQRIHVCQSVSSVEWNKSYYLDWSVGICIFLPILNKNDLIKCTCPWSPKSNLWHVLQLEHMALIEAININYIFQYSDL